MARMNQLEPAVTIYENGATYPYPKTSWSSTSPKDLETSDPLRDSHYKSKVHLFSREQRTTQVSVIKLAWCIRYISTSYSEMPTGQDTLECSLTRIIRGDIQDKNLHIHASFILSIQEDRFVCFPINTYTIGKTHGVCFTNAEPESTNKWENPHFPFEYKCMFCKMEAFFCNWVIKEYFSSWHDQFF